jgi:transposase-like protein
MIPNGLQCPHCHGTAIVRPGKTPQGKQRYRCRERSCHGRPFLLDDADLGHSPPIKEQMVERAMHASGIRDTARVLPVSPTTVIKERNKRHRSCTT